MPRISGERSGKSRRNEIQRAAFSIGTGFPSGISSLVSPIRGWLPTGLIENTREQVQVVISPRGPDTKFRLIRMTETAHVFQILRTRLSGESNSIAGLQIIVIFIGSILYTERKLIVCIARGVYWRQYALREITSGAIRGGTSRTTQVYPHRRSHRSNGSGEDTVPGDWSTYLAGSSYLRLPESSQPAVSS